MKLDHVSVAYHSGGRDILAVDDISMAIEAGKCLGVVGESGSGKSTLANAVLRLLPPDTAKTTGEILFMDRDILACDAAEMRELRWKQISAVFQKSMNALSPVHKIGDQLSDIYHIHDTKLSKKAVWAKIIRLFGMVNLPESVYKMYPHELSGGMLQRISIAASLLNDPSFLILDEATTALDVITQGQILDEIKKLKETMNVTWMLITHDISAVVSACDRIAVLYAGRLMEYGDVDAIMANPTHPYTKGLLSSFPKLYGERCNLKGMEGSLPDMGKRYEGCIFAPRCPYAEERCSCQRPPLVDMGDGHLAACFSCGDSAL